MNHVFVTGGTGFVGAYLLHYLVARGDKVRAMRRKSSPMELVRDIADKIEWVDAELLDERSLEDVLRGIDQVYHSAAVVSFNKSDAEQMFRINIEGTANIVNAALSVGVKKMLHVSSIAALGRKDNQIRVDENSPWENAKTNSNYAISKFKAECEVWRGIEEGLQAAIINPSMILGAGYWNAGSNQLFTQVHKGFSFYPIGTTGMVDVRDVAKSAIVLMNSDVSGERFIVSSENWTYKHFVERVALHLGIKPPHRRLSPFWAGLAWRGDAFLSRILGRKQVITREAIQSVQATHEYDNQKIIKTLNYSFIPIEQTVADTCKALLEAKKSGRAWGLLDISR